MAESWCAGAASPNGAPINPSDADWGNGDLEWLQLESCQVLRDTTGTLDQLARRGGAINGFHTNAYRVDGGTGRRFAALLFSAWWRPAFPRRRRVGADDTV